MNYLNRIGGGYETPTLEVIEVAVEQGFAASPETGTEEGDVKTEWWD